MDDPGNSRRRRGLGVVTPNACTECRKKRAKCDGHVPCRRCAAQINVDCIYEVPVRQSKENMRTEIEQLRLAQRQTDRLLAALVSNDTSVKVLDQLRNGETIEAITKVLDDQDFTTPGLSSSGVTTFSRFSDQQAISSALRPARSIGSSPLSTVAFSDTQMSSSIPQNQYEETAFPVWGGGGTASQHEPPMADQNEDMMRWESEIGPDSHPELPYPLIGIQGQRSRPHSPTASAVAHGRTHGQEVILGPKEQSGQLADDPSSWTSVTSNGAFVNHLMALYFCWEYPTFASLSKEHFLDDFKSGTARYCSSLLVNAILALGCRLSSQPEARSDPNDKDTAGDHFFAEAMRLLESEGDRHVLTTIQALGLMALREASCGRSSEGLFLSGQSIRLAIEIGLHQDTQDGESRGAEVDHEVRSATFWGAFSLDQAWSLSIGKLPHFSRDLTLVNKPAIVQHVEASAWIPYTDDGAPLEKSCTQPSNVRSVYKSFCELSEIIHKSLYTLYTPGTEVTSKSLLSVYRDYLQWYESLTPVLRLGHNFTPAVLFAHMHYHFAILLLFRPFIKLSIVGSGVTPRDVSSQAADAISALVKSYSQLYTLRRTPSFVPYFVLTSSIAHLVTLGNSRSGPEQVLQGLADLKELAQCHAFAVRALDILRFLVRHWEIEGLDPEDKEEIEDIKMMCRPRSKSLNQFCPNVEGPDVVNGIRSPKAAENPLFWTFPLQGRPLLDVLMLKDLGFVISSS